MRICLIGVRRAECSGVQAPNELHLREKGFLCLLGIAPPENVHRGRPSANTQDPPGRSRLPIAHLHRVWVPEVGIPEGPARTQQQPNR